MESLSDFVDRTGKSYLLDHPKAWLAGLLECRIDSSIFSSLKKCIDTNQKLFTTTISTDSPFILKSGIEELSIQTHIDEAKLISAINTLRSLICEPFVFDIEQCNESILDKLTDPKVWENYRNSKGNIPKNFKYDTLKKKLELIVKGTYQFSIPFKIIIDKGPFSKKRTVYNFDKDEMIALGMISQLLRWYDFLFESSLYSFRPKYGVHNAIQKIKHLRGLKNYYVYKADIKDYFNSVPVDKILDELTKLNDPKLYYFFKSYLNTNLVKTNNGIAEEYQGIMIGTPTSSFLANYYLRDIDTYFESQDCYYFRYCDDILILSKDQNALEEYRNKLREYLDEKQLSLNENKEHSYLPGETFDYLGLKISPNEIDISDVAVHRIKNRIRNITKKYRKTVEINQNSPSGAVVKCIYELHLYLYSDYIWDYDTTLNWYFSKLTTSNTLHEIDIFCQNRLRFVITGKFNKTNYKKVPYEQLKKYGYKPLVSAYFNYQQIE